MNYIFSLALIFLALAVSANAQTIIYQNNFTAASDLNRLEYNFSRAFRPEAPAEMAGNYLSIRGNNGHNGMRGYTGYIVTSTPLSFVPGYVYTVTFRARTIEQDAEIRFQRGNSKEAAASTSGTPITGIAPRNLISSSIAGYTNYTATFTVSRAQEQYLAFYVNSIINESNLNNEYLFVNAITVTQACSPVAAPTAASVSRCGAGSVVLSAAGAPTGGGYRWYEASSGGTAVGTAASFTTPVLYANKTYFVSAVNAAGCESGRVAVTATIARQQFANTEFAAKKMEAGKPGVLELYSDVFDRGHGETVTWQVVSGSKIIELGTTTAPTGSPAVFQVAAAAGKDSYYRAIIKPIASVCYYDFALDVTSEGVVALPVTLVSFKAVAQQGAGKLSWSTASELNNDKFVIERSQDGKSFKAIAEVKGRGTTNLPQSYAFTDNAPAAGANYYRLRQVDYDGTFEYSKSVALQFTFSASSAVFPTLATEVVTVRLATTEGQVQIFISDMSGKQLAAVNGPSERQVVLPVQHLKSGTYFVTVLSDTQKETIRFVKK